MFNFIKYRLIFFIFSGILIAGSLFALFFFGLRFGIEFSGGTLVQINYRQQRPSINEIKNSLAEINFKEVEVKLIGERGVALRIKNKNISSDIQQQIKEKLKTIGDIEEEMIEFETISPAIGKELKAKTQIVTIFSILIIIIYIALVFRKVSRPISSWQYGIVSLIAMLHDLLIVLGVLAVLGKFYEVQITIPIITAFLVIVGYAINDKIVVFDRIRENLLKERGLSYEEIVNLSLNQSITRCLNTSLTTIFVLLAIFFFGGATLKYFSLVLTIGVAIGTYSSLCLAALILVSLLTITREKRG